MVNESSPLLEKEEGSHRYYHVLESAEIGIDDPESSSTTNITTTSSLLSSNKQASINIIKMCIGSGTLAMPYAAHQGGVLFHVFGLAMITKWNLYSVDRMLSSKQILCQYECMKKMQNDSNNHDHHIQKDTETSDRTKLTKSTMSNQKGSNTVIFEKESKSTFSNIAYMVFGPIGVHMVDTVMTILMVGIILAYEDAILGFIQQTPLQSDNPRFNAIFMVLFIVPVLMLPNYESIAKVSALGTGLVCAVFGIVAVMGILQNGFAGFFTISWDNLWPSSLSSLSSWFGIAVFGYGIVPFTFTMQESMVHPSEFKNSCNISLWIVFVAYCIMGNGLSIIFMQTINSDVLSVLPHGIVPTSLRLLMVIVILTTLPLIIIPAGALVHDKVFGTTKGSYIFPIRLFIAIICAVLSVELPNFVFVLSFIGCLCVSFISFVYPPLVHIICTNKFNLNPMSLQTLFLDGTMLTWGIFVTIFTSRQTYLSMMQQK
jgi:amino acid permease